ncbi:MAG: lasso peptide biosynthesis B2 protein [Erythrobacter sp.]
MLTTIKGLIASARVLWRHRLLAIKTLALLVFVRLSLTFAGYRSVLDRIAQIKPHNRRSISLPLLAWWVERLARYVPQATCMTQALTLRYLAAREGHPCTIRIGVRHDRGKKFEAHAWVIAEDRIVIGGLTEDTMRFTPILDL